jgi:hypothetical protein
MSSIGYDAAKANSGSHSQNYGLALQKAEPSELIEVFLTLISALSLCYL